MPARVVKFPADSTADTLTALRTSFEALKSCPLGDKLSLLAQPQDAPVLAAINTMVTVYLWQHSDDLLRLLR